MSKGSSNKILSVLLLIVVVDILLAIIAVLKAPFPLHVDVGAPTAYLSIYIHVPLAWSSYLLFTLALIGGILYLVKGDEKYDRLTRVSAFLGVVYGIGTIVTGMAWASESWGAAWNWDPRETGVLLLLLAYIGYFALRQSIPDPERKRLVASIYAIVAFATVPLSFAAAYATQSLHPKASQAGAFFSQPEVLKYFVSRVIIASITAVLLVAALISKRPSPQLTRAAQVVGALIVIIGLSAALYAVKPFLLDSPARVLNATLNSNGEIVRLTTSNGNYTFQQPVKSPVNPPLYNGTPSVIGHLVVVSDNSVDLVIHWCVALVLGVYALIVGGILLLYTWLHKLLQRV
ncbi:MAG: cytochrome c biogenesis protein [Desulfurococcales archaeon]|nr:cytochrome c biogenesis protein [Desulfurococcales archaeon]